MPSCLPLAAVEQEASAYQNVFDAYQNVLMGPKAANELIAFCIIMGRRL